MSIHHDDAESDPREGGPRGAGAGGGVSVKQPGELPGVVPMDWSDWSAGRMLQCAHSSGLENERADVLVQRPLFTVDTLAEYLSISRWTVYKLVRSGDLRPVRVGQRLRFRPADIDHYLDGST